jgi:hypothetical protein
MARAVPRLWGTAPRSRCNAATAPGPAQTRIPAARTRTRTRQRPPCGNTHTHTQTHTHSTVGANSSSQRAFSGGVTFLAARARLAKVEGIADDLADRPGQHHAAHAQRRRRRISPRQWQRAEAQLLRLHLGHHPHDAPQHANARRHLRRGGAGSVKRSKRHPKRCAQPGHAALDVRTAAARTCRAVTSHGERTSPKNACSTSSTAALCAAVRHARAHRGRQRERRRHKRAV